MKLVERIAKVGEKIQITKDIRTCDWDILQARKGDIFTVEMLIPNSTIRKPHDYSWGLVACEGLDCCVPKEEYLVLED